MEDVLDLYHEDYDPERPVVCFDETSKQLIEDVRPPIKAKPGSLVAVVRVPVLAGVLVVVPV